LGLRILSGDKQRATGNAVLPEAIVAQVVDSNLVPYAGHRVNAVTVSGGSVSPASVSSDESGLVRFNWTPGPGPVYQVNLSVEATGATVAATALTTVHRQRRVVTPLPSYRVSSAGIGTSSARPRRWRSFGHAAFPTPSPTSACQSTACPRRCCSSATVKSTSSPLPDNPGQARSPSPRGRSPNIECPQRSVLSVNRGSFVRVTPRRHPQRRVLKFTAPDSATSQPAEHFPRETTTAPASHHGSDAELLFMDSPWLHRALPSQRPHPASVFGITCPDLQGAAASSQTQFGF
jgi:hypothetical protein